MQDINSRAKLVFLKYLREKGLKNTKQRKEILDSFLKRDEHITAEQLYEILREKNPQIGYATVYRTLKLMCDCELADEIKIGNNKAVFEHKFGHKHHDHLICLKCGEFIEVRSKVIEKIQDKIAQKNNFIPLRHKLEIFGLCKNCK